MQVWYNWCNQPCLERGWALREGLGAKRLFLEEELYLAVREAGEARELETTCQLFDINEVWVQGNG